jgi:hypothetical protein
MMGVGSDTCSFSFLRSVLEFVLFVYFGCMTCCTVHCLVPFHFGGEMPQGACTNACTWWPCISSYLLLTATAHHLPAWTFEFSITTIRGIPHTNPTLVIRTAYTIVCRSCSFLCGSDCYSSSFLDGLLPLLLRLRLCVTLLQVRQPQEYPHHL